MASGYESGNIAQLRNITHWARFTLDFDNSCAYYWGMSEPESRTPWTPTPEQREVLSVFQSHGYRITVASACAEAKVGRRTYYDWHDKPEFSAWWEFECNRFFRLELHRVYRAAYDAADPSGLPCGEDGNQPFLGLTGDRKLLLERFDKDYCPKSRTDQNISGGLAVDLSGMSDDEVRRFIEASSVENPEQPAANTDTVGPVGAGPA